MIRRLLKSKKGQGLAEYSLIIAVVAVAALAILTTFRGNLQTAFTNLGASLTAQAPAAGG